MPQHILILEPKHKDAETLTERIAQRPEVAIHRVHNLREACSLLTVQPVDLALVPVTRNDSLVYSLRMLQPDLPLILIADADDQPVPIRQEQAVWGIVTRRRLAEALPDLDLLGEDSQAVEALFWPSSGARSELERAQSPELTQDRLAAIAQELLTGSPIQFVMFLKGQEIIGYHSANDQEQLVAAAAEVRSLWHQAAENRAQIQFLGRKPAKPAEEWVTETLVLYTRPLGPYLITVGARAATRVSDLRRLVQKVSDQIFGRIPEPPRGPGGFVRPGLTGQIQRRTFVLFWQTRTLLPAEWRRQLHQILPVIGASCGIGLDHLIINERFVHVVATAPPQRGSSWLAQTLKDASAARFQAAAGIGGPLWATGYYAKESATPLSAAELNRLILLQPA